MLSLSQAVDSQSAFDLGMGDTAEHDPEDPDAETEELAKCVS